MTSYEYTPPPNPGDTLKRVLVIKLGAMGDFMQALGAMRVVRATHPSARITLLTTEPFEAFAKACPYFDIVEADGRPKDLKGRADLIRRLRNAGYDMVYDFQNNDRTSQYFMGLTGKKPLWSGHAKGASHQHMNDNRGEMHNFDRLAEQLLHAGLTPKPPGDPTGWVIGQDVLPSVDWIRPAFRDPPRFQPAFFSLNGPYMLLIPGSSPDHPEKRWPADRFAKIATWVADAGITPVVVGTKAEGDIGAQIQKLEPRAKNIVGRTDLFQLATLAERAAFALGGDTGPMHLAAAARTPGVCLFAQEWTDDMARELRTVWNPKTRLGRAAPRGGAMMVLHAAALEGISVDDVKRAALGLGVLPPNITPPAPVQIASETPASEPLSEPAQTTESSPEVTEGSDS
ncbi:MAG TPA: glycosyltransferase family 9 protein [Hyphomonadaceae bacterium]|nr:glycosyltransferase family 9 protein [Hyphomonadaceae bacterium]HPN05780.1 glycosyltransferase family 9 protein [Hyphomonadaceae bacterium]